MEVQHLPTFVAASVILMFIPGVDMALVTRQVIMHGRSAAFASLAGLLLGGLLHATFAMIGLSAVLLTSATAYTVIKTAGAVYLLVVGVQTIWTSWQRRESTPDHGRGFVTSPRHHTSLRRAFALGFLSDATNPKVAIFFLTFLPQFVASGGAAAEIAFLGILFNAIATSWWIGYVLLVDRVGGWLHSSAVRRVVENLTGTILVGLGLRVAFERR